MNKLHDMSDDVKMKIYEIESFVKCICNSIECCSNTSEKDCIYILPLAQIARRRLENLSTDYEEFEGEIYRQLLL